jgi:hypothetical protein
MQQRVFETVLGACCRVIGQNAPKALLAHLDKRRVLKTLFLACFEVDHKPNAKKSSV